MDETDVEIANAVSDEIKRLRAKWRALFWIGELSVGEYGGEFFVERSPDGMPDTLRTVAGPFKTEREATSWIGSNTRANP